MDKPDVSSYNIGEMPVADYQAQSSTFASYHDAAVVFIGRPGGEGGDLSQDIEGWDDNYTSGQHQLELNKDELDLIDLARDINLFRGRIGNTHILFSSHMYLV